MTETTTRETALDARLRRSALRQQLPPPAMRRAIRVSAGLSAAAVGDFCGVSRQIAAAWERGDRNPSGERLERYAELLRRLAQGASA